MFVSLEYFGHWIDPNTGSTPSIYIYIDLLFCSGTKKSVLSGEVFGKSIWWIDAGVHRRKTKSWKQIVLLLAVLF